MSCTWIIWRKVANVAPNSYDPADVRNGKVPVLCGKAVHRESPAGGLCRQHSGYATAPW